jgi:hypothetical protein
VLVSFDAVFEAVASVSSLRLQRLQRPLSAAGGRRIDPPLTAGHPGHLGQPQLAESLQHGHLQTADPSSHPRQAEGIEAVPGQVGVAAQRGVELHPAGGLGTGRAAMEAAAAAAPSSAGRRR